MRLSLLMILTLMFIAETFIVNDAKAAAPLTPGDIVVGCQSFGQFYKIDPISGTKTLIASEGLARNASHLILDDQGKILTASRSTAGIVRIDPVTGNEISLFSGGYLTYPVSLAFGKNNNLIVGNYEFNNSKIINIDLQTGVQTVLPVTVASAQDVDVDSQGRIVILDTNNKKIVRFDPQTSQQTTIASSGNLIDPADLVIAPSGDYYVTNGLADRTTQILDVNPLTGAQNILMTVPSEGWIALQDPNNLVYAKFYRSTPSPVMRLNLKTKETQTIGNFDFTYDVTGVAIYSPVPEPTCLALLLTATLGGLLWWRQR